MICAKFGWNWPRRRFFLICQCIFAKLSNYLPLEKGRTLLLNKFEFPSPKDDLCQVWICWNWPSGTREEDFKNSSMYFRYFLIISPWKKVEPFIWTNLNPLHPRMLCAKFGWNWSSGSGEVRSKCEKVYDNNHGDKDGSGELKITTSPLQN